MKIACLIDNLGSGGAQRQLVNLAVGFCRRGHEVRFLTYHPADFYTPILDGHGIEHVCIDRPGIWSRLTVLRREIRRGDQEAMLAFLEGPALWAELAGFPRRRWGLVVSERFGPESFGSWQGRLLRRGHYLADHVTVNSVRTAKALVERLPRLGKRVQTVYNVVDFDRFAPSPEYAVRSQGRTTLVVAASYQARKNLDGLIEGVSLLDSQSRSRLRIQWYGDKYEGAYERAVETIRQQGLDEVFDLCESTTDIHQRMKSADGVGLFSLAEGLPNTICEGLACGKPVLMSRLSDADVLVEEGKNGWLCDPHDPASIAAALDRFVQMTDQQAVEMGRASRLKAEELFDPDKIVAKYLELLAAARDAQTG